MSVTNFINSPSLHEREIRKYFSGRVHFNGDEPLFDKPLVVLLFTNRCGSNLFADHVVSTGLVAGLEEATNHPHVKRKAHELGIDSYPTFFRTEAEAALDGGAAGYYGVKASVAQLAMLTRWNICKMFNGLVVYRVVRENTLAQSVSMMIAEQTGQWTSQMRAEEKQPEYSFDQILRWVNRFTLEVASGKLFLNALDCASETFVYEEFRKTPQPFVRRAIELLGEDAGAIEVSEPNIQRQANQVNQDFRQKFIEDIGTQVFSPEA